MSHDRSTSDLHDHMGVMRVTISEQDGSYKLTRTMPIFGVQGGRRYGPHGYRCRRERGTAEGTRSGQPTGAGALLEASMPL
jgi:hypothetical protein